MDDAVPAGAHQYSLSGRVLATRREGFPVCPGRRLAWRGGAAAGGPGNLHRRKSVGGCAHRVSTGGLFFYAHPGMPARGRGKSADGVEEKAAGSGGEGPAVTQTKAYDGCHRSASAGRGRYSGNGFGLSSAVG